MSNKIGRNSPCPCGSGKKFKKCCCADVSPAIEGLLAPMPDDLITGTKIDFYFDIYRSVVLYAETLKTDPKFGSELKRICRDFEERFEPGTEHGLPDSFYLNWFLFDNRFGIDQHTVIERMMKEEIFNQSNKEVKEAFSELADSYATCHQIKEIRETAILFEELITGSQWTVNRLGDIYEEEAKPRDIWHARFVGPQENAYYFGQPFIFEKEAKKDFIEIVSMLIDKFEEYASTRSLGFEIPRDAFKAGIGFWAGYLHKSSSCKVDSDVSAKGEAVPHLSTTDGEKLRFSEVIFNIVIEEEIRDKLSRLRGVEYDEERDCWIWLKKGNRRIKSWDNTILGQIRINGKKLVGEVNSLERALRLKNKLSMRLGKSVAFEQIDSKDFAAMPEPSREEMRKFEEEQRRINSDPDVREALIKRQQEYYLKDWVSSKIPALDGKTPRQAVKTKEGRLQLEVLINWMEGMENTKADYLFKMDMNFLRDKLGLPLANRGKSVEDNKT